MTLRERFDKAAVDVRDAVVSTLEFFGPVANAVRGTISREEWVRAATKAAVAGGATKLTILAAFTTPDAIGDVVVPIAAAAVTGALDALSRFHQGETKATP